MWGCPVLAGAAALIWTVLASSPAGAQAQPLPGPDVRAIYDRLLPQIEAIRAFDNHGHPGYANDSDVDAMSIPPDSSTPLRLRDENTEILDAVKFLFNYPYADFSPEHQRWLVDQKAAAKAKLGRGYFSHILDQVGIETAIANRVSIPSYLDPARFRWVYFVDNFLFPFDTERLESRNPDQKLNLPLERKLLARNLAQAHIETLPADFDGYLKFATGIIEDNKAKGEVGLKFEIAYYRSLHFDDPEESRAAAVYTKYRAGGVPTNVDYRDFQDYVFRYLLREAARLHLPVQIHTAVGGGDFYMVEESSVMGLENILRDPRYENVTFVLLHGGYPHQGEAIWLTARKNVYLDSSLMGIFVYPAELHRILKQWLELFPDKIVFGSDTFPLTDAYGAEETYWLATESARLALAGALAEMVSEKEISETQALQMAHAYLHDTAAKIYSPAK
jgi:predicted TIM-barrel fold metal-dependent hydrolase